MKRLCTRREHRPQSGHTAQRRVGSRGRCFQGDADYSARLHIEDGIRQ